MNHVWVQLNVLFVIMAVGAMGPPLIAPLRETFQHQTGLSRAALGWWVFGLSMAGSTLGLLLGIALRDTVRTTFMRWGTVCLAAACALLAVVDPAPGPAVILVALAWLFVSLGRPLTATSNGISTDLWAASPRTGVIILHAVNSLGKVAAPVLVLAMGTALRRSAGVYAAMFAGLAVWSFFWPKDSLAHLRERERQQSGRQLTRLPRNPVVWLCVLQFAFIAGSEGGATAILGSFVERLRPTPVEWIAPARWPSVVIAIMLGGIVVGRVVFAWLSLRLSERAIIICCLACGVFAAPGVFCQAAWAYVPSLMLTGVCFSATWPAFFALCAQAYPAEKTFLSFGAAFFNVLGISACVCLSSVIGNTDAGLPYGFLASTAAMAPFAAFLFATRTGRGLRPSFTQAGA